LTTDFQPTDWASYDVTGTTLEEAARAVINRGEGGCTWHGATYALEGDTHVTGATVTIQTRVTLPQWSGYATASAAAQAEWDRFHRALMEHEYSHLELVTSHLTNLDERMVGGSHGNADTIFHHALRDLTAAEAELDSRTDHGRNTGTVIDVSIDSPS
jgi:predicted secreted Zn-dependent protease